MLYIMAGWTKQSVDPKGSRQETMHSCKSVVAHFMPGIRIVQAVCSVESTLWGASPGAWKWCRGRQWTLYSIVVRRKVVCAHAV